ncbi:hypothetical protein [Pontibacter chitinilyticus]|uniref:hypothetical protein n=1 Tax=Pontibacter chitinilyticus TaxID=2674989 RepID=UPI0032192DD9
MKLIAGAKIQIKMGFALPLPKPANMPAHLCNRGAACRIKQTNGKKLWLKAQRQCTI